MARLVPDFRSWTDSHNKHWFLCDTCDAPMADAEMFVATVANHRTAEAGAFYCRSCASLIVTEWALRLTDGEHVEDCWCLDPLCGIDA